MCGQRGSSTVTCESGRNTEGRAGQLIGMGVEGSTMGAGPSAAEARFTQLYARYKSPIRAFCNRRVLSDAVDDAVAEAFLTMWRRIDEVPDGDAALVWLYSVAYRVI